MRIGHWLAIFGFLFTAGLANGSISRLSCKEIFKDLPTQPKVKIRYRQVEDKIPQFVVDIDDISVRFKNQTNYHLDQSQLELMAVAAFLVWKKAMNLKQDIEIDLTNHLGRLPNGIEIAGSYFPDNGKIGISLDRVFSGYIPGVSPLATLIFIVSHEMTHKVQQARGETMLFSSENPNYDWDPQEIEANFVALDVFKAVYPGSRGHFTMGAVSYIIPQKSSYTFPKAAD